MSDTNRLAAKVNSFVKALTKVSYSTIENRVSVVAAYKLDMARDALQRQQSETTIANFLADAQIAFDKHSDNYDGSYDLYKALDKLK